MHPMMGKLAHPWGRPIRPSASGRLPHRSHCQCCSRCGSYHRPRCGSHHVRWLVLGFLCLERSWLLIETKMRRIDHKWWDDLIHRLYRNIRSLERNMNNFVGGHARQIIIYIYMFLYKLQTRTAPIFQSYMCCSVLQKHSVSWEYFRVKYIESTVNTKVFPTQELQSPHSQLLVRTGNRRRNYAELMFTSQTQTSKQTPEHSAWQMLNMTDKW